MIENKHAIIVIRNIENEYLQYYDNRWDSYLFLNCKLDENFNNDFIIKDIIEKLELENNEVECTFLMEKTHTKFSQSAKKEKTYHHYFYEINIKDMPALMNQKEFSIHDIKYAWFSMSDLERDERIQQVNIDIVNFIKEVEKI